MRNASFISQDLKACETVVANAMANNLTQADRDLLVSIANWATSAAQAFDDLHLITDEMIEEELVKLEEEQKLREEEEVMRHERWLHEVNYQGLYL